MFNVFFELEGSAEQDLLALVKKVDTVELLDEAAAFLLNRIRTRFLQEKTPEGASWPPSAAAIRRRIRGGTGTLFDTGQLFHSIQAGLLGDAEFRTIETDVPYGKYHQYGTSKLPKREFLGFSDSDVGTLNKILQTRLDEMVNKP